MTYRPDDWKPGAMAAIRYEEMGGEAERQAIRTAGGWCTYGRDHTFVLDRRVIAVRPLVVLDPESDEDVQRFIEAAWDRTHLGDDRTAARDALRSLVAKPKPPEPMGLGAVVKDRDGKRWVRADETAMPWVRVDLVTAWRDWSSIDAAEVLHEGVRP